MAKDQDRLPGLDLAERVAEAARELGIETALIGAMAMAVHKYLRGTADVDLGTRWPAGAGGQTKPMELTG